MGLLVIILFNIQGHTLHQIRSKNRRDRPLWLVLGMLNNKDLQAKLEVFFHN